MSNNLGADDLRLDDLSHPAWVWDPDRARIVDANGAAVAFWDEPGLADLADKEFGASAPFVTALAGVSPQTGDTPLEFELPHTSAGANGIFRCQAVDYTLNGGRQGYLVQVLNPVTPSNEADAEGFALAGRKTSVALLVVGSDGDILVENDASFDLFGKGREAQLGQRLGSKRAALDLLEEALIEGRSGATRHLPTRIGPRLCRVALRRAEDPANGRPVMIVHVSDVEDHRTREYDLEEQIKALTDFLAIGADFYLELDQDLRVTRASAGLARHLGTTAAALTGTHWRDLVLNQGLETSREIDMAMGARSGWQGQDLSMDWEGTLTRFSTSALPLSNDRGDFRGFRLVAHQLAGPTVTAEVTPLPRDEPAKASSDNDFKNMVDAAPWAVAIVHDFTPIYLNMAFAELFGLDNEVLDAPEDVPFLRLFTGNQKELRGDVRRLLSDDLAFSVRELKCRHLDGRELTVQLRARKVTWEGDPAIEFVLEDVSAYRNEQTQVDDRAEMMTAVLDLVPESILLMKANGVVDWVNTSAMRLLGLADDGTAPYDISDVVGPEDSNWAFDYIAGLADGALTRLFTDGREITVIDAEGTRKPALMALERLSIGEQVRVCAVLRDISEWRTAETVAAEMETDTAQDTADRTEFLARISHELRTPLTAILGFAQVMSAEELGPMGHPKYLEYARDIETSGEHLLSLINDLLDMSKIDTGKLKLNFASVDLETLSESCARLMRPVAEQRNIRLRMALPEALPPVVADERSLRQILLNLMSNALRFTESEGQVTVTAFADEGGGLTLSVTDTGVGMSDEELAVALEPFEQVEKAVANGTPGTGLGLPIARALTEANRAFFQINSAPDAGTTVAITFPSTQVLAD